MHRRRRKSHPTPDDSVGAPSPVEVGVGGDQVVAAAAALYGARGFRDVPDEEVAQTVGITPASLAAMFPDPGDLYAAVYRLTAGELSQRLIVSFTSADPVTLMREGLSGWLAEMRDPAVRRIIVLDAPEALGWARWRAESDAYGRLFIDNALAGAMDEGLVREQPVRPLGHVIAGALEAAVLYAAHHPDPDAGLREAQEALEEILDGIVRPG